MKNTLILLVITVAVALLLSVANMAANGIMTQKQLAEQAEARAKVLGDIEYEQEVPLQEEGATVWKYLVGEETVAYAAIARGNGYGGEMEIMVGMDANFAVLGVDILMISETPGLGTKVEEPSFLEQFIGKTHGMKLDNEISAISGATVSSKAVTEIVNRAIDNTQNLVGAPV